MIKIFRLCLIISIFYPYSSLQLLAMEEEEEFISNINKIRINLDFSEERDFYSNCADYSIGHADAIHFKSGIRVIPNLENKEGYLLEGINLDDDLFMYVSTKFSDLRPNTKYQVVFKKIEFATNVAKGRIGAGGSPGESVHVKVGASTEKPEPQIKDRYYRMNIDQGRQNNEGKNAVIMGNFSKTSGNTTSDYEIKTIEPLKKYRIVETNSDGELWFFAGTDSGFQSSKTAIYFTSANFELGELH